MKIALYYGISQGGVYGRVREIKRRTRHDAEIVSSPPDPDEYDVIHSYSNFHGGQVHTAECNWIQAIDYATKFSKYAVKYTYKGLNELRKLGKYRVVVARC